LDRSNAIVKEGYIMPRLRQAYLFGVAGICTSVLLLAACVGTSSSGASSPGATTGTPSATSILQHAEQAPLKDATFTVMLILNAAGSTGGTTTVPPATSTGNGRLTTNPKRTDLNFSAIQFQGATTSAEIIIDASSGDYYIKVPALPKWVKVNPAALGIDVGVVSITDYSGLQNLTFVAAETVNGVATWHIRGTAQVTSATGGGSGMVTRTEDLWFRQSDYYPVKIAIQDVANAASGGLAGTPSATPSPTPSATVTAQAVLNETFTFTQWDSGITIQLPPPGDVISGP
jgi:hypothetical protein